MEQNVKGSKYVTINGQRVDLTDAQMKGWNKMINDNRRHARNFRQCSNPNWSDCYGDCAGCKYACEGTIMSSDKAIAGKDGEIIADGFGSTESAEEIVMRRMTLEALFAFAAKQEERGDEILRAHFRDPKHPLSSHKIGAELGIAPSTVNDRLNRLLEAIRANRENFL